MMTNFPNLQNLSRELQELSQRTSPWVVTVQRGRGRHHSGILWDNQHVLSVEHGPNRDDLEIGLPDGPTVAASVLGRMKGWDLILIRLETAVEMEAPPWTEEAQPGLVLSVGRESNGALVSSLGMLSSAAPQLIHRTPFGPEFAGGPLVDVQGRLLGLNAHGRPPEAIPTARLKSLVQELAQGQSVEASFLGLGLLAMAQGGCLVVRVEPGSPAEFAGVLLGDQLSGLETSAVNQPEDVQRELRSLSPGRQVQLSLARSGQPLELTATLAERRRQGFPDDQSPDGPPGRHHRHSADHVGPKGPPHRRGRGGPPPHRGPHGGPPPPRHREGPEIC